jgi:DNA repair exonuclease SbcCD ATPase subunit
VSGLWAVADDNFFRRPWKKWQAGFGRLEIATVKKQIADEQARLDADASYQAAGKKVADARASMTSGDNAKAIAAFETKLEALRLEDLEKDLNLRFIKSELEEWRYFHDDALHHHNDAERERWAKRIEEGNETQREREKIYQDSQAAIAAVQKEIADKQGELTTAEEELAKLTVKRDELQSKLETVIGYLRGRPRSSPLPAHSRRSPNPAGRSRSSAVTTSACARQPLYVLPCRSTRSASRTSRTRGRRTPSARCT